MTTNLSNSGVEVNWVLLTLLPEQLTCVWGEVRNDLIRDNWWQVLPWSDPVPNTIGQKMFQFCGTISLLRLAI